MQIDLNLLLFTLADFVFAVATNFNQEDITVTTVGQICYLGMAKGDILYGESKFIKDGRTTCFYEIVISDNLGNNVAIVTMTGAHLKK